MNFFGLSPGEILLIMMLAMIVLGPEKLPEVAGSIGKWIAEFRRATQELTQQFNDENPFAEIQRALNLSELSEPINVGLASTATPTTGPAPEPVPTSGPSAAPPPLVVPEAIAASQTVARGASVAGDFFARAPRYPHSSDEWVHGAVPESWASHLNGQHAVSIAAIDADWAHGVPVVSDPLLDSVVAVQAELAASGETHEDGSVGGSPMEVTSTPETVEPEAGVDSTQAGSTPDAETIRLEANEVVVAAPNDEAASHRRLDSAEPESSSIKSEAAEPVNGVAGHPVESGLNRAADPEPRLGEPVAVGARDEAGVGEQES